MLGALAEALAATRSFIDRDETMLPYVLNYLRDPSQAAAPPGPN